MSPVFEELWRERAGVKGSAEALHPWVQGDGGKAGLEGRELCAGGQAVGGKRQVGTALGSGEA